MLKPSLLIVLGLFVGSFNFDLRSAGLNTEMGFLIDGPKLASAVAEAFGDPILGHAYQVVLPPGSGQLQWVEENGAGQIVRHLTEPGTLLLSVLPIDWLL